MTAEFMIKNELLIIHVILLSKFHIREVSLLQSILPLIFCTSL